MQSTKEVVVEHSHLKFDVAFKMSPFMGLLLLLENISRNLEFKKEKETAMGFIVDMISDTHLVI